MNDNQVIKRTITANEQNSIKINPPNNKSQLVQSNVTTFDSFFDYVSQKRDRPMQKIETIELTIEESHQKLSNLSINFRFGCSANECDESERE